MSPTRCTNSVNVCYISQDDNIVLPDCDNHFFSKDNNNSKSQDLEESTLISFNQLL